MKHFYTCLLLVSFLLPMCWPTTLLRAQCPAFTKLYVDSSITLSASNDGSSWSKAFKEFREALAVAARCNSVDSILVAKGTYKPDGGGNRDTVFVLRGRLKLHGSYPQPRVEINPDNNDIVWNNTLQRWEITFNTTGFSGFFIGDAGVNILPLTLLHFSGKIFDNSNAQLSWRTANEVNASHFELQRSSNGRSFSPAIRVQAKGTVQSETDYSFTDRNLVAGGYYYRLRMVDKDGKETYSQVVTVMLKSSHAITLYPVPDQNLIWLAGGTVTMVGKHAVLMDEQGRVLQIFRISQWPQQVDVSDLAIGTYLVKIQGEKAISFIKQ